MRKQHEALKQAISRIGAREIAAALGISVQAVHQWPRVPGSRVLEVERITGVSRHDLRPDIFGASKP